MAKDTESKKKAAAEAKMPPALRKAMERKEKGKK